MHNISPRDQLAKPYTLRLRIAREIQHDGDTLDKSAQRGSAKEFELILENA
jgi:hypothetical protein